MADNGHGGLSSESFESIALDVGDWVWGTVQGAFNEKATLSQILVDAVIGMIPVVGDVTGVRDLIAVVIGLSTDPRKREDKFQWMMLVVLIFALIPVIGGVIKGVGRLLLKAVGEAARLAGQGARAAHMAKAAKEMIEFLNRVGVGHAERWLTELKFVDHQQALLNKLDELTQTVTKVLENGKARLDAYVPDRFVAATDALIEGLKRFKAEAERRVPDAIKELDESLREIQAYIRSGGETTSQAVVHTAAAGAKQVHRTEELMLLEGKAAKVSRRGGMAANSAKPKDVSLYYTPETGFPDITAYAPPSPGGKGVIYPNVATYAGKIVNRELQPGERVFRVFGPGGGSVFGVTLKEANNPAGKYLKAPGFWGLNEVPTNARTWREKFAVLDEWNHNQFIVVGTVLPGHTLPACTGLIAEQAGKQIGSQYLVGGAKQAMMQLPEDVGAELNRIGQEVMNNRVAQVKELGGIRWEFRPTNWEHPTGLYGYLNMPGPGSVQTAKLGAKTLAEKREE